jgi:hypothetical protein
MHIGHRFGLLRRTIWSDVGTLMSRNITRILRFSNMRTAPCSGTLLGITRVADEAQTIQTNGALLARLHDAPGTVQAPAADAAVCRGALNVHGNPEPHSCREDSPTVFYFTSSKQVMLAADEQSRADDYIQNHLLQDFQAANERARLDVRDGVRNFRVGRQPLQAVVTKRS